MRTKHEQIAIDVKPGLYVVAVSGGVDSVVLLDLLSRQSALDMIVAHFDHGIRSDSAEDRKFAKELAKKYKLPFEYAEGKLGPDASEEDARDARYEFLQSVKDKHEASAIITAHHEDDVIETAILNLMRGTHNRGLSSLKSTNDVLRPLLHASKAQITEYAEVNNLHWKEDPSNKDTKYLRNYVRLSIIPALNRRDPRWRQRLLNKIKRSGRINLEVDSAISYLVDNNLVFKENETVIPRHWLIMLPNAVGLEVIKHVFVRLKVPAAINQQSLKSTLLFCKTAQSGKRYALGKMVELQASQKAVRIIDKRLA
ncbi:MAG TPA: tRNA lysidine(34) synthetase TilS [Candidatus Saccharimonadales bacterium]|jgi:tRNA(Ile)-lysidine synthase